MNKNKFLILKIIFFPVTILLAIFCAIYRLIDKKICRNFVEKLTIKNIDTLDGYEFEEFLFCFFKSLGLKVKKTQASKDYGADLILKYHNKILVIQSKLYYKHSVSLSAVQEIATAKNYYNADFSAVITNSQFTKSANTLAISSNTILVDRNALENLLNSNKDTQLKIIHSWFKSY